MKSKTSCFNRTIFKKNFTHYWPLWALYLAYLIVIMPVCIWQMAAGISESYDRTERVYDIVESVVSLQIVPNVTFFFSAMAALAVFSYLYSSKNANMIHALPVNRFELFLTNYLSGLLFLLIPEMIAFLVAVLVCIGNEIMCIQYLFMGFVAQIGVSFFAYSMAVFVAMFTGHILAMPVYFYIGNYLYVGCLYIISIVKEIISFGVENEWNPGKSCILSPQYYLRNNLRVRRIYYDDTTMVAGIEIRGMHLVALYAVAAVILIIAAYVLYKRRHIECAGDFVSVAILKPIFRWGMAFCGGILLAVLFTEIVKDACNMDVYWCMVLCVIVTGCIFFFMAEMLLCKNFRVFSKKRVIEWGSFTVVAVIFITLFRIDAFGIERKVPKNEEIEAVFVNMNYPIRVEPEEIPEVIALHQKIVSEKNTYTQIEKKKKGYYYTTIRYYLKDGSVFERRYPLPITEPYLNDKTSPTSIILEKEREVEHLKQHILGRDYEKQKYVSGKIDYMDEEKNYIECRLNLEELEVIVEAIENDIEDGNMEKYYVSCVYGEEIDTYYNTISIDYYNQTGITYDSWDYYNNYNVYLDRKKKDVQGIRVNSYITFGPKCINTVKALKRLGLVDDTRKLITINELSEME